MSLNRINLLLLGLVLLLALAALIPPRGTPQPLTPLRPEGVQRIRVSDQKGLKMELVRHEGGWRITRPRAAAADSGRAEALTAIAAARSFRSFPAAQADPAALGLAPAPLRLELDRLVLEIGGTEPVSRRRYIRIGGQVHLVEDRFQHLLLAPADSFATKPEP